MTLFASIVVGIIAGWLTGKLMRGSGFGLWGNLLLGLIGSAVGSWLGSRIFNADLTTGINLETILTAVVGSVITVSLYQLITNRRV